MQVGCYRRDHCTGVGIASGVDVHVNYEVAEGSGKIISTGTPFRPVYRVIHLRRPQENQAFDPQSTSD